MAVTSGKINLQSKHDLFCHVSKVKAAASAHSMAEVIPFLAYVIFSLNQNEKKIYFTYNKENNI